jgi:hypothetical protein
MKEKQLYLFYGIILYFVIDSFAFIASKLVTILVMILDANPLLIPICNLIIYIIILYFFFQFLKKKFIPITLWFLIILVIFKVIISYMNNVSFLFNESLTAEKLGYLFSIDKTLYLLFNITLLFISYWKYSQSLKSIDK